MWFCRILLEAVTFSLGDSFPSNFAAERYAIELMWQS
jgi:hypothetical protein